MSGRDVDWQGVLAAMDRMNGESVAVTIQDDQGRYLVFMHGWLRGRALDLDDDRQPFYRLETGHPVHRFDETGLLLYEDKFASAQDAEHTLTIYHDDYHRTTITLNVPLGEPV